MDTEKTLGESRVRVLFNPSLTGKVDLIKQKSADLINLVNSDDTTPESSRTPEYFRLKALAMTAYEEAAMWAVKAATI